MKTIEQVRELSTVEFTNKDKLELLAERLDELNLMYGINKFKVTKTSINKEEKHTYEVIGLTAEVDDSSGVAIIVFADEKDILMNLAFTETSLEDITYDVEEVDGQEIFTIKVQLKSEVIEFETTR